MIYTAVHTDIRLGFRLVDDIELVYFDLISFFFDLTSRNFHSVEPYAAPDTIALLKLFKAVLANLMAKARLFFSKGEVVSLTCSHPSSSPLYLS